LAATVAREDGDLGPVSLRASQPRYIRNVLADLVTWKDWDMKKLAAPLLALTLAVTSTTTAFAGGPVVVEDTTVEAETPRSGWIVPVVVGLVLICAIACGGDDDPVPAG
jgi:hypothetical protein